MLLFRWLIYECGITKRLFCHASNNILGYTLGGSPMSVVKPRDYYVMLEITLLG